MYLSRIAYTGNGLTHTWTVPFSYIDKSHVKAYLNGVSTSFTWISQNQIKFTPTPAEGVIILIKRETPKDERLVDFSTASLTDSTTFDTEGDQQFFISQELLDDSDTFLSQDVNFQWDAEGKLIKNLNHPVDPTDAATKHYVDKGNLQAVQEQVALGASYVIASQGHALTASNKADEATQSASNASDFTDAAAVYAGEAAASALEAENYANSTNPNTVIHTQASGLDNPGYTKAEADNTFYNKTQLNSVTDSDSGADKIGATTISGLTGETVQTLLESLKANSDLKLPLSGGTLSGALTANSLINVNAGLKFPATQAASSDANTLDDYEEGTWTPTITYQTPGNLSVVYSSQAGYYTKLGNFVHVQGYVALSSFIKGTASGYCCFAGLPFIVKNVVSNYSLCPLGMASLPISAGTYYITCNTNPNLTLLIITGKVNNGTSSVIDPDSDSVLYFSLGYFTN